jgi:hypothetical protein
MHTYTVFLPNEFDELTAKIAEISTEKNQSPSATIRDMLCKATGFKPARVREIKNYKKYTTYEKQDEKK